jgi:hypothetical protein
MFVNRICFRDIKSLHLDDPSEIESALRAKNASRYASFFHSLHTILHSQVQDWVGHWSLWVTTCCVSRRLTDELFPGFFHHLIPLPDDTEIESRLKAWAVNPSVVLAAYQQQRSEARLKPPAEQLRGCVHAKMLYRQIVVGKALQSIDHVDARLWMSKLAKWMTDVPADLAPMLQLLLQ